MFVFYLCYLGLYLGLVRVPRKGSQDVQSRGSNRSSILSTTSDSGLFHNSAFTDSLSSSFDSAACTRRSSLPMTSIDRNNLDNSVESTKGVVLKEVTNKCHPFNQSTTDNLHESPHLTSPASNTQVTINKEESVHERHKSESLPIDTGSIDLFNQDLLRQGDELLKGSRALINPSINIQELVSGILS